MPSPGLASFLGFAGFGTSALGHRHPTVVAALEFAKVATGRSRIISTTGGHHAKALGALADLRVFTR